SIITEDSHALCRLIHIWVTQRHLFTVDTELFRKFSIRHQNRHHTEKERRSVPLAAVSNVLLNHLRILVVDTGHDCPSRRIIYNKMIGIRPCCGFVLRHTLDGICSSYSSYASSLHTPTHGMYCFDYSPAK